MLMLLVFLVAIWLSKVVEAKLWILATILYLVALAYMASKQCKEVYSGYSYVHSTGESGEVYRNPLLKAM